jgi:transposase
MLHVLRVGCPWRDIHERYGKWNSVYVRFRRWAEQGVWDALLQTLVDLGLTDDWQHMIDSTMVRGHVSAAGGKGGGLCERFWSITRRIAGHLLIVPERALYAVVACRIMRSFRPR